MDWIDKNIEYLKNFDWEYPIKDLPIDKRVQGLIDLDLNISNILEVGCYEGLLSCQLANQGYFVHATDVRVHNLVKTTLRSIFSGLEKRMMISILDCETIRHEVIVDDYDCLFHSGVFYHLSNPVQHLKDIAPLFKYMLLETHVANYEKYISGKLDGYQGTWYPEGDWNDGRAAKDQKDSFWLAKDELKRLINDCNLKIIKTVYENEPNPHGERVCYLLERI